GRRLACLASAPARAEKPRFVGFSDGGRRDACPTFRFTESFNLQFWTRIGAMNQFAEKVGRLALRGAAGRSATGATNGEVHGKGEHDGVRRLASVDSRNRQT